PEHEEIARTVQRAFSDCRFMSVDMLLSGKVMEVNAFPGGRGLLDLYGISVGNMIIDRLEDELLGLARAPASIARSLVSESTSRWDDIDALYEGFEESVETLDVFSYDGYTLSTKELVEFRPGNLDFILSIPHAGVLVPTDFAEHFELDTSSLVEIDLFSDVIFEALGGAQVISRLAPFFVDMNREREGSKGKQIPKHLKNPATEYYTVQDEPILQEPYSASEEEKVIKYYDLYHEMLSTLIERMKRERGYALIIDGHSMMSTGLGRVHDTGQERDNFVLGTLGGTSACEGIVSAFGSSLKQGTESHGLSLTFAKDDPYSGGFITRKHHDPKNNVHVIQVEVTMGTYMYEPVDEDVVRRYALKQPRVTIVQDILRNAVRSACEMAERVYLR
ncbi:MAG: N-formylglutamate amidohydrolase, partial [Dehalococcoidia bacterium]